MLLASLLKVAQRRNSPCDSDRAWVEDFLIGGKVTGKNGGGGRLASGVGASCRRDGRGKERKRRGRSRNKDTGREAEREREKGRNMEGGQDFF